MAILIEVEVKIAPGEYTTIRMDEPYLKSIAVKKAELEWSCDQNHPTALSLKVVVDA